MSSGLLIGFAIGLFHWRVFSATLGALFSGRTGASRSLIALGAGMRMVITALVALAVVGLGVSPAGLGWGILAATLYYRLGLWRRYGSRASEGNGQECYTAC